MSIIVNNNTVSCRAHHSYAHDHITLRNLANTACTFSLVASGSPDPAILRYSVDNGATFVTVRSSTTITFPSVPAYGCLIIAEMFLKNNLSGNLWRFSSTQNYSVNGILHS